MNNTVTEEMAQKPIVLGDPSSVEDRRQNGISDISVHRCNRVNENYSNASKKDLFNRLEKYDTKWKVKEASY